MNKYLLLPLFLIWPCLGYCQYAKTTLILNKVDSILHAEKKYKKAVKKIDAIPAANKEIRVVFFDSSDGTGRGIYITDSNGNDLNKDICCYQVGYKTADADKPHFIYYVYYSVNANRIMHASKKVSWSRTY